tara:strand:- start:6431 stop:6976 length:546 start_codon:yes stop_codon:yes gene_type:complete
MSDNIIFEIDDYEEEPNIDLGNKRPPKPTVKKERKKRVLTEEQRARNIENLKKGRAKALETRKKNSMLRKIQKEEDEEQKDLKLKEHLMKKKGQKEQSAELLALKEELNLLRAEKNMKNFRKEKKVVEEEFVEEEFDGTDDEDKPVISKSVSFKEEEPPKPPSPPPPKKFSTRNKITNDNW